jgi:putative oxidoreductase
MGALLLLGRLLFGGFFLFNGVNHFMNLAGLTAYAASRNVPMPQLAVIGSGVLLLLGGLSIITGVLPRLGLALVILFLVPVSVMMHPFWTMTDAQQRMMEMTQFMKNLALTGAAFGLMAVPVPWPASMRSGPRKRTPGGGRWQTNLQT